MHQKEIGDQLKIAEEFSCKLVNYIQGCQKVIRGGRIPIKGAGVGELKCKDS